MCRQGHILRAHAKLAAVSQSCIGLYHQPSMNQSLSLRMRCSHEASQRAILTDGLIGRWLDKHSLQLSLLGQVTGSLGAAAVLSCGSEDNDVLITTGQSAER